MKNQWKEYKIRYTDQMSFDLICSRLDDIGIETLIFDENHITYYSRDPESTGKISDYLVKIGQDPEISVNDIDNSWEKRLHGDFREVEAGRFVVLSKDYIDDYKGNLEKIIINPAQAFGSGQHATTKQCLELIQDVVRENNIESFLEPGCGTSILSLLAYKLGISKIAAFDHDFTSMLNARENQELNSASYRIFCSGLTALKEKYDLVAANIFAHVLIAHRDIILDYAADNGFLILSGIEKSQGKDIEDAFSALNLIRTLEFDGWKTFLYRKN